jgi:hypothetical protein
MVKKELGKYLKEVKKTYSDDSLLSNIDRREIDTIKWGGFLG